MTIWLRRIACWIAESTDTHSEYVTLLLFHYKDSCTNAPRCYVYTHCLSYYSYGRESYNGSSPLTSQAVCRYTEGKWKEKVFLNPGIVLLSQGEWRLRFRDRIVVSSAGFECAMEKINGRLTLEIRSVGCLEMSNTNYPVMQQNISE